MTTQTLIELAKNDESWEEAADLIDELPAAKLAKAVRDFEAATKHWPTAISSWDPSEDAPSETRDAPTSWINEIYAGEPSEKHSLIRILRSPRSYQKAQKLDNLLLPEQRLHNVRELMLRDVPITARLLKAFSGKGMWQRWESLHLWNGRVKPSMLKILAQVELSCLRQLNLAENYFGVEGAKELQRATKWTALQEINIAKNNLGDPGVDALAGAAWLKQLKGINLDQNNISDEGLARLTPSMPSLRWISLSGNPCTAPDKWVKSLPGLETLRIAYFNEFTDESVLKLLEAAPTTLSTLQLNEAKIGDASASALAKSGRTFHTLNLIETKISAAGLEEILMSPHINKLQALSINANNITAKTVKLLIEDLPALQHLAWMGDGADAEAKKLLETKRKAIIPHLHQ